MTKRPNNGKLKIEEIKQYIRDEKYTIHPHFDKRFQEREITHRDIHRLVFDGKPEFQLTGRVAFRYKKHCLVVEVENKPNGKVLGITLLTVY
jgi:hypothetical protein